MEKKIINCLSKIEASIDFSDEDGVPETINITNELKKISKDIMRVLEKGENYELITTGNQSNVNRPPQLRKKSSLFNYIIKKQQSIVTKTPGTTRDVVEKKLI